MIGDKKIDMLEEVIRQYDSALEKLFYDHIITSEECQRLYMELEVFPRIATVYHPNNMVCIINRPEPNEEP